MDGFSYLLVSKMYMNFKTLTTATFQVAFIFVFLTSSLGSCLENQSLTNPPSQGDPFPICFCSGTAGVCVITLWHLVNKSNCTAGIQSYFLP